MLDGLVLWPHCDEGQINGQTGDKIYLLNMLWKSMFSRAMYMCVSRTFLVTSRHICYYEMINDQYAVWSVKCWIIEISFIFYRLTIQCTTQHDQG